MATTSASLEEGRATEAATASTLLKPSLAILIVNLALVRIGQHGVSLADLLENLARRLLVVRIFVLPKIIARKVSLNVISGRG